MLSCAWAEHGERRITAETRAPLHPWASTASAALPGRAALMGVDGKQPSRLALRQCAASPVYDRGGRRRSNPVERLRAQQFLFAANADPGHHQLPACAVERGALVGATMNQAFYVKCDEENNPPARYRPGPTGCRSRRGAGPACRVHCLPHRSHRRRTANCRMARRSSMALLSATGARLDVVGPLAGYNFWITLIPLTSAPSG